MTITLHIRPVDTGGYNATGTPEPIRFVAHRDEDRRWQVGDYVRRGERTFRVTRRTWEENGDLAVNVEERVS